MNAPSSAQAKLLSTFVDKWYVELKQKPNEDAPQKPIYPRPQWYTWGDINFEGGAYYGRWCVEAVAAVKAFGLDDSLCLGHLHYPGDLLRPECPSTHPIRQSEVLTTPPATAANTKPGLLAQLFGRK